MIGWDGADRATIEAWTREGVLPNLAALRERGAYGHIESLPGLADDACWSSFATGTGPSTHGRFHYRQTSPGSYQPSNFFRDRMTVKPFWSQLGDAGRRVAILDVPKSPLARDLNGIQLADWLPHGEDGPVPVSWPPALANELATGFGESDSFNCHWVRSGVTELAELRDRIHQHLEMRTELALDWLRQERWDLFLAVFAESHCIGHHCWHLHDCDHPDHDRDAAATLGDPLRDIHQALDASLGRIMAECGPETTVIVFSLLGMGPNYTGTPLADAVLRALDVPQASAPLWRAGRWLDYLRRRLAYPLARMPLFVHAAIDRPELAARKAFIVHSDAVATAIRLNVVGREPHGKVRRSDYDERCRFLTKNFLALTDPDSGRSLVSEVVRVIERFPGPYAAAYADLLVIWNAEAPIRSAASDAIGVIGAELPLDRSGNHRPGGWYIAAGPGLQHGEASTAAAIVDLAPTVAAILGVELTGVEGAPIRALAGLWNGRLGPHALRLAPCLAGSDLRR
jgi:predicted AlkP superfamily phosphohydrolase/phosphomutase